MKKHVLIVVACGIMTMGFVVGQSLAKEPAPGTVISKVNYKEYKEYLPMYMDYLMENFGFKLTIKKSDEYPLWPKLVEATNKNSGNVKLDKSGKILNYISGVPFPEIDAKDPDAGLKVAWNYTYRNIGDDWYTVPLFQWKTMDGKLERQVDTDYYWYAFKNRQYCPPMPDILAKDNRNGLEMVQAMRVLRPYDIEGTGFVLQRFSSNNPEKYDDTVAYVPAVRRLRRWSSKQVTDAFLGTDVAVDDFHGYSGSILRSKWKFIGKQKIVAFVSDSLINDVAGSDYVGWFPKAPYEIAEAYVVEETPLDKSHHYSKRLHYFDTKSSVHFYMIAYDRNGKFWKFWNTQFKYNKKNNITRFSGVFMVDVQRKHVTVVPCGGAKMNQCLPPDVVSVSSFLKKGSR